MPQRNLATKALARIMSALSHADRLRIVEELREGERDVGTLAERIGSSAVRVSQNMAVLRAHNLVAERREGRHVYYRLAHPTLARWVLEGLRFVAPDQQQAEALRDAVETAVALWSAEPEETSS